MTSRGAIAASVVALAVLAAFPLAGANVTYSANGHAVSFQDRGGNEWWVQVHLSGTGASSVSRVDSMDTDGAWTALKMQSYGDWAASYHVEPGHLVRYRATWADGTAIQSCWFTHPQGAESCNIHPQPPPPPPSPPPPSGFDATFSGVRGNEWWVQATVAATGGTLAKVDVSLNGGAWQPLAKQSWGGWAASYHAVGGTIVQMRATSSAGATDLSGCYRWIPPANQDAGSADCSGTTPPPPPPPPTPSPTPPTAGFSATFTGVKGNEWWVEARATGSKPIAKVDARVDGGTWVAMKLQGSGAWAVSTHAVQGSVVQLRATASDGSLAFPPNGWVWTGAREYPMPAGCCTPPAIFEDVKGNANWVQVNAYMPSDHVITGVEARVGDGSWQAMQHQAYGDWAAPLAVPAGSLVQFRACSGGFCPTSGQYSWPPAPPAPWPVAGRSYATYHVRDGGGSPGGDFYETYEGNITMRYTAAGTWTATCDGMSHHFDNWGGFDNDTYTPFHATATLAPPMWPTGARPDQDVTGKVLEQCHDQDFSTTVVGSWSLPVLRNGQPVQAPTRDSYYEPCPCAGYEAQWARQQGLLLKWWFGGMAGGLSGELVDTDAPVV